MPTNDSPTGPLTELGKYATLCGELSQRVEDLGSMHAQRAEFTGQLGALKITRDRLNESILDCEGPAQTLAENLQGLETERLVLQASLDALTPRVDKAETELHARFPLALLCFERLRGRVATCTLDADRARVLALLAPGYTVAEEHINAIGIAMPAFVEISRLTLPSLTHTLSRPLEFEMPRWSSLVRPFTEAEKTALRQETVKALLEATTALLGAARRLIELIKGYPDRVPEFRCEVEPEVVAPQITRPEWNEGLFTTDAQFVAQHCKESGKDPASLSDRDKGIIAALLEERRKMPVASAVFIGELVGSTVNPAETAGFGGPAV